MTVTTRHYDTILSPVITEKATVLSEHNKVVFRVSLDSTKEDIASAVEQLFKVKVTKVNTLNVRGKARRKRTAQAGKAPDWKKAIVTLKDGDKIVLT